MTALHCAKLTLQDASRVCVRRTRERSTEKKEFDVCDRSANGCYEAGQIPYLEEKGEWNAIIKCTIG